MTLFLIVVMSNHSLAADENLGFRGPLNFIQSKVLEDITAKKLTETLGGSLKVKIQSYGAKALRNGIFKSATLAGKNISVCGINISSIEAETITENNRIDISNKKHPVLLTDILLEYNAELTNADIDTIVASNVYRNELAKINKKLEPYFRVYNTKIYCQDDRLFFNIPITSELLGLSFVTTFSTDIYSDGNKTDLRDVMPLRKIKKKYAKVILSFINSLNPVNIIIKQVDNARLNVSASDVIVSGDKIQISGIIKIDKETR